MCTTRIGFIYFNCSIKRIALDGFLGDHQANLAVEQCGSVLADTCQPSRPLAVIPPTKYSSNFSTFLLLSFVLLYGTKLSLDFAYLGQPVLEIPNRQVPVGLRQDYIASSFENSFWAILWTPSQALCRLGSPTKLVWKRVQGGPKLRL